MKRERKVIYQSRSIDPKTKKPYQIIEFTEADDASIKLRALALNWDLIYIEIERE